MPDWMLNMKQCDMKEWKKIEKVPISRKLITTEPKSKMPKRFMKKMEKNMRRLEKIKGKFNPPREMGEGDDDDGGAYEDQSEGFVPEEKDDNDEWVEDDDE